MRASQQQQQPAFLSAGDYAVMLGNLPPETRAEDIVRFFVEMQSPASPIQVHCPLLALNAESAAKRIEPVHAYAEERLLLG